MKKILCLMCVLLVCGADNALANFANMTGGLNPGAINSMETRNLRMHELQTRNRQKSAIVKPKNDEQAPTQNLKNVSGTIDSIVFVDNNNIPTSELNVVVRNYINAPLNSKNMTDIRKQIMKYYQANGYYSAVPYVVSFDKGQIVIQIKEGPKNSIIVE